MTATITLVRHGETAGESSIRYHGRNDVPLNEVGITQMRRVGEALRHERFDHVYTSTLGRSVVAAAIIAPTLPRTALPGFDEIHFGDWEGLTAAEIEARDAALYRRWRADMPSFTYPGGDSVRGFRRRVVDCFAALRPTLPERTLIVVHKGVIAAILAELFGKALDEALPWRIDLGSIHRAEQRDGGWHLAASNLVP